MNIEQCVAEIKQLDPNKGNRDTGVRIAATGNMEEEFKYRMEQAAMA